jgi:hypothetical protein
MVGASSQDSFWFSSVELSWLRGRRIIPFSYKIPENTEGIAHWEASKKMWCLCVVWMRGTSWCSPIPCCRLLTSEEYYKSRVQNVFVQRVPFQKHRSRGACPESTETYRTVSSPGVSSFYLHIFTGYTGYIWYNPTLLSACCLPRGSLSPGQVQINQHPSPGSVSEPDVPSPVPPAECPTPYSFPLRRPHPKW